MPFTLCLDFGVLHQADGQKLQVRERNACLEALRAWHVFHDRRTIKHCLKLQLIPCGDQQASQCLGTHKGNEASKRHQLELELELDHRYTHRERGRERERERLSDTMLPDYSANFLFFVVPLLISIDWIVSFVGLLFQSEPQLLYCNL